MAKVSRRIPGLSAAMKKAKGATSKTRMKDAWRIWRSKHKKKRNPTARKAAARRSVSLTTPNPRKRRSTRKGTSSAARSRAARKGWSRRRNPLYRVRKGRGTPKFRQGSYVSTTTKKPRRRYPKKYIRQGRAKKLTRLPGRRGGWNPRGRRNPSIMGSFNDAWATLTSVDTLTQFGIGAVGATVSMAAGNVIANYVRKMLGANAGSIAKDTMAGGIFDAAAQIASGVALAGILLKNPKHRNAAIMGAGIGAVGPLVKQLLKSVIPAQYHEQMGLAGWLSVSDMHSIPGLSGWVSLADAQQLGLSGMSGGGPFGRGHYAYQPGMSNAFTM